MKPALEVADIFRRDGATYRADQAATLSNSQRRVMAAIEACRTSALGGHVERCANCRELPKVPDPGPRAVARRSTRRVAAGCVFPRRVHHAAIAVIALLNKAVVYDILFKGSNSTGLLVRVDAPR